MGEVLFKIQKKDAFILELFNTKMKCKFLDIFMPLVTYLGSTAFCIIFSLTTTLSNNSKLEKLGVKSAISLLIGSLIVRIIKVSVSRMRPYLRIKNLNIRKIGIDKYSFPSGHTTAAFSLCILLSLNIPHLAPVFIILACCVGMSRMYFGVHYPTDVFVGILIGSICSSLIYFI
ncbi:MAG: phosphatase PAP2 family protein [Bacillota bacterium]|nr:phosphatase PAP2 family protein [Bacillota bacterium]